MKIVAWSASNPRLETVADLGANFLGWPGPLQLSSDGARMAFVVGHNNFRRDDLYTMRLDGTDLKLTDTGFYPGVSWSPDGTTLAVQVVERNGFTGDEVFTIDPNTGNKRRCAGIDNRPVPRCDVGLGHLPAGAVKLMHALFLLAIVAVAISSVSCLSNKETTWDWVRQEQDQYVQTDRGYIAVNYQGVDRTPRWTSDGQTLVVNTGDRLDGDFAIYGVRLDGSALWRIPAEPRGVQLSPVISSDNRVAYRNYEWISRGFIAEKGSSAHHHHVVVSSLDGAHEEWRVKLPVDVDGVGPAWMPDNAHLAVALSHVRGDALFGRMGPGFPIYAVDETGEFSLQNGYGLRYDKGFAISPDGRHAAYQPRVPSSIMIESLSDRVVISSIGAGQTGKHVTNGSLQSLATGESNTWWSLSRAAWSTDGQQLFFAMTNIDATKPVEAAIMSMAPDGSLERVADVNPPTQIYTAQPSPDGQRCWSRPDKVRGSAWLRWMAQGTGKYAVPGRGTAGCGHPGRRMANTSRCWILRDIPNMC